MDKKVSIIIPTYSRPDNLCRAIDSVLDQTYKPIEIIVVDDNGKGSDNQIETEVRLSSYIKSRKITYICHEVNKNGSAARNTGFKASSGEYINFLDDDDTFEKDKIAAQVAKLESVLDDYGACYCWRNTVIDGKIKEICRFVEEGDLRDQYLMRNVYFNTSAILFRRHVLEELNGFDDTFIRHQDWEIMMRFWRKYKIAVVTGQPLMNKNISKVKPALVGKKWLIPVKEKFLNEFSGDILSLPHGKLIIGINYFDCALNAMLHFDFVICYKFLKKTYRYKSFELNDIVKLIHFFLRKVKKSIIN